MSQENVEVVRKGIDALNRGDLDGWAACLSPDVVWESRSVSLGLKTYTEGGARCESGSRS